MANFVVNCNLLLRRLQLRQSYILPTFGPSHKFASMAMKPPNILVYQAKNISDCSENCLAGVVEKCLPVDKFVVYRLRYEEALSDPWMDNCKLLVIPDSDESIVFDSTEVDLLKNFLLVGGKILNFSVNFAKHFNLKICSLNPGGNTTLVNAYCNTVVEINETMWHGVAFQTDECDSITSNNLLFVKHDDLTMKPVAINFNLNGGQVLHVALPMLTCCTSAEHCKDFSDNKGKLALLTYILNELKITNNISSDSTKNSKETPCVILSENYKEIENFVECFGIRHTCVLKGQSTSLKFILVETITDEMVVSDKYNKAGIVPVFLCYNNSSLNQIVNFDWTKFWDHLETETFAKSIIYSDVVTSTMDIVEPMLGKFLRQNDVTLTCIAKQQTKGRGRGGNKWLSPPGTAMFSHVISIPLHSNLGQHLSILQHLTTVAVVHGIRSIAELAFLDLRVKWPNDIYIGRSVKIGGVLVKSTLFNNNMIATIGCGVNVSNEFPTKCINDAMKAANISYPPLTCEEVLARTFSCLEYLIKDYQLNGPKEFLTLYYKYWIHMNQKVNLQTSDIQSLSKATVVGIDGSGFLCVVMDDNQKISLQPDSNSFDMMKNLIAIKSNK